MIIEFGMGPRDDEDRRRFLRVSRHGGTPDKTSLHCLVKQVPGQANGRARDHWLSRVSAVTRSVISAEGFTCQPLARAFSKASTSMAFLGEEVLIVPRYPRGFIQISEEQAQPHRLSTVSSQSVAVQRAADGGQIRLARAVARRLSLCGNSQVGASKDKRRSRRRHFRQLRFGRTVMRFYIDRFGRFSDHHWLMECPPIDFVGRLQIGREQAVFPLQALDHRAHVVASPHDAMVRLRCLRQSKVRRPETVCDACNLPSQGLTFWGKLVRRPLTAADSGSAPAGVLLKWNSGSVRFVSATRRSLATRG
jgi:hypothetical protein